MADKAEASRFTGLQNYLEAQAAAEQRREAAADAALGERFALQNKLLMARLEQSDNTLAAFMGQLEDRLERRGQTTMLANESYKTPLADPIQLAKRNPA